MTATAQGRTRAPWALVVMVAALGCGGSKAANPDATSGIETGGAGGAGGSGAGGASADAATDAPAGPVVLHDGGTALAGTPVETFDTGADSFVLDPYHDTVETNLGDPISRDGGAAPALGFDPDDGSPTAGSLKVTIPFTGPNQYVDIQSPVFVVPQNWSGQTLHVRIKIDGAFSGFAELFVDTGATYAVGETMLASAAVSGSWQDLPLDLDEPMTTSSLLYTPKQVVLYGVEVHSGATSGAPVTVHVDSFTLQ